MFPLEPKMLISYKRRNLVDFLLKQGLKLKEKHLSILRNQDVTTQVFLGWLKKNWKNKDVKQGKYRDRIRIYQTYTTFLAVISFVNLCLICFSLLRDKILILWSRYILVTEKSVEMTYVAFLFFQWYFYSCWVWKKLLDTKIVFLI